MTSPPTKILGDVSAASPAGLTPVVNQYQKGKTNLDFTGARDSVWQWHQLGHMQVCTSLQTDNHASTPPLCFLQAGCPSCRPTSSVKAMKAQWHYTNLFIIILFIIIIIAVTSVGYELTQMNLNSQMNSVNVSYEFELTNFNKCNL